MQSPNNEIKYLTVSDINRMVKNVLSNVFELRNIWVRGEISNYSTSSVGHVYFSLKDKTSILRCSFFANQYRSYKGPRLKDGIEVFVYGSVSVYEAGGAYNLNVSKIEIVGKGDIHEQIEKLKQDLYKKGIFDPNHKKPLPKIPKTLGIATSPYGAAVEDIIKIAKERNPWLNILVAPCVVQGEDAPRTIVQAINWLNQPQWNVDVIIAGRGGGSFEDLMAFNEESVVMAFYQSRVPIVSAVGHQIDSVLSDLSADLAAPTPSAAAKSVVPDIFEIESELNSVEDRLYQAIDFKLHSLVDKFKNITGKLVFLEPRSVIIERYQKLDDAISKLMLSGKNDILKKSQLIQSYEKFPLYIKSNFNKKLSTFQLINEKVENFSPLLTLKRGYSVIRNNKKVIINSYKSVKKNETLEIILSDGKLKAMVLEIEQNDKTK